MAKNKERKLFALALSAAMAVSAFPTVAFAEEITATEVSSEITEGEDSAEYFETSEEKNETEKAENGKENSEEKDENGEESEGTEENETNEENKEEAKDGVNEEDKPEEVIPEEAQQEELSEQTALFTEAVPINEVTLTTVVNGVTISMTSPAFKEGYKLYAFENPNLGMYGDSYKNKITSKKQDSSIIKNYSFIIAETVDGTEKNLFWDKYFSENDIPTVTISGLAGDKKDSDIGLYYSSDASRWGDTFEITDFNISDGSLSFKMSEYFMTSKTESSVNSGFGSYLAITQVKKMSKCDYDETAQSRWTVAPVSLAATTEGITYTVENDVDLDNQGGSNVSPIKIIIPEGFDAEKFDFDGSKAIMDALEYNHYNAYQPGDKTQIKIIVENKSGYDYKFAENSFKVGKADFEKREGRGVKRLNSNAVKQLLDITNYWDNEEAMAAMDEILKEKGYEGGISDFHKYFTDFYNFEKGTEINHLNGISNEDIYKIAGEHGATPICEETNTALAQLFDDVFYQMLFSLRPDIETAVPADYTIGKLAADTNILNEYVKENMGEVKKGETSKEMTFIVAIDGAGTGNMYQNYDFGTKFGFEMTKVAPPETPDNPGGGGGGRTGDITPDPKPEPKPENPPIVIEDEEVPLAEEPKTVTEEVPVEEISEEPTQEVVEIEEEEVPLGEAPATGDSADITLFGGVFAAAAAMLVFLRKKRS